MRTCAASLSLLGVIQTRRIDTDTLLEGNFCSLLLDLLLDILGSSLVNAFLYHLRSVVNEILCLLESKSGNLTNYLDDLDLVRSDLGKLYVELGLLFLNRAGCGRTCNYNSGCGGNTKLLLAGLYQIV